MTRILVIDDDRAICEAVRHILVAAGYAITIVHNGPDGLEAAQKEDFALALVDLCMSGVNGFDIIRALQHIAPRTQLVIFSGLISESDAAPDFLGMAANLQGVARLSKPVRRAALLDLVKECTAAAGGAVAAGGASGQENGSRVSTAA